MCILLSQNQRTSTTNARNSWTTTRYAQLSKELHSSSVVKSLVGCFVHVLSSCAAEAGHSGTDTTARALQGMGHWRPCPTWKESQSIAVFMLFQLQTLFGVVVFFPGMSIFCHQEPVGRSWRCVLPLQLPHWPYDQGSGKKGVITVRDEVNVCSVHWAKQLCMYLEIFCFTIYVSIYNILQLFTTPGPSLGKAWKVKVLTMHKSMAIVDVQPMWRVLWFL